MRGGCPGWVIASSLCTADFSFCLKSSGNGATGEGFDFADRCRSSVQYSSSCGSQVSLILESVLASLSHPVRVKGCGTALETACSFVSALVEGLCSKVSPVEDGLFGVLTLGMGDDLALRMRSSVQYSFPWRSQLSLPIDIVSPLQTCFARASPPWPPSISVPVGESDLSMFDPVQPTRAKPISDRQTGEVSNLCHSLRLENGQANSSNGCILIDRTKTVRK